MEALPLPKHRGDAFERLTQLYLQTVSEYHAHLRHVWLLDEVPPSVRKKLNLPDPDEGIDLIAQTRDGTFWAIQSKFRSGDKRALTKDDLDSFSTLAFVHCRSIEFGLVAHTSAKPVRKLRLLGNISELGLGRWVDLTAEQWEQFHAKLRHRPLKLEPRPPRPHQQRAIEAARRHFRNGRATRGRLIMPCGTGKSLSAYWIARDLKAKSIVVAVPSLVLITQCLREWTREYLANGVIPDWLCVCSDDSTGKLDRDEFVGETYDLGIPATTDPGEIAAFLRRPTTKPRVVFTTYQSGRRLAQAARAIGFGFDLVILDEAHKTVGEKSKAFATLLHDRKVKAKRRLFMTATERVLTGESDDVLSMDDAKVYGERFFQLTFKEAIADELISDYRILTVTVSEQRMEELIAERRFVNIGETLTAADSQLLAAGIALKRAAKKHGVRHAISFHKSIHAAKRFGEQQETLNGVRALGPRMTSLHISSKQSAGERAKLMRDFPAYRRSLLTNARCLTEGVDIPAVDCVLFANPKQSVVDIVQAAGRAMRLHRGKKVGYILLPVVVPEGEDIEAIESTEFRQVARTITALSTQDERIAEEFRLIHGAKRWNGKLVQFEGDVPLGAKMGINEFATAIGIKVWQRVGRANWRPFTEAREHVRGLGLRSPAQWREWVKSGERPPDIPTGPGVIYSSQWQDWRDWLGTNWRPFTEAREHVRRLGLRSGVEWNEWAKSDKRPRDIPATPQGVYSSQWQDWRDWLGTNWRPFTEAREHVRGLGLRSRRQWNEWAKSGKRPHDIPYQPDMVYSSQGWQDWRDWLGTNWRPFTEAREHVRRLGLRSGVEWNEWVKSDKRPPDIPASPERVYRDSGWLGRANWLGTRRHKGGWREFKKARRFVRSLGLRSGAQWREWVKSDKRPHDIPASPERVYHDSGWLGRGDWLGTRSRRGGWREFEKARRFARSLGLRGVKDWQPWAESANRPLDIPSSPRTVYHDSGWRGWPDWLGTE